jgi:plasmid stabilization system protein ParE
MKRIVHLRQRARQDLIDIFRYYVREAGLKTARRLLHGARDIEDLLAEEFGVDTDRGS